MAVKQPAPVPLNRVDVLLPGVGFAVGAFAVARGVYAMFHSGKHVGRDDATNVFAAIVYAGLGLVARGAMRRRYATSGLGPIFTALAPVGLAWPAGMLPALIGAVLIVCALSFTDLLPDRGRFNEEAGEDVGNVDQGGLTTSIGEG